jgi:hypothetical protein
VALAEAGHYERTGNPRRTLAAVSRADSLSLEADFRVRMEANGLASRAYAALGMADSAAARGLAAVHALERVRAGLESAELRGSLAAAAARLYGDVVLLRCVQPAGGSCTWTAVPASRRCAAPWPAPAWCTSPATAS